MQPPLSSLHLAWVAMHLEVSKVGLRASVFRRSQLPLVWWRGSWHIFELWDNSALGFFCISNTCWVWTEPRQPSCATSAAGQANEACPCLLCMQPSVFMQGERAGGCVFKCTWSLCSLVCAMVHVLAHQCRGRELCTQFAKCQPTGCALCSWQEVRIARWQVTRVCSARHTCSLQGFLPLETLSWWERRVLHKPVLNCFALC